MHQQNIDPTSMRLLAALEEQWTALADNLLPSDDLLRIELNLWYGKFQSETPTVRTVKARKFVTLASQVGAAVAAIKTQAKTNQAALTKHLETQETSANITAIPAWQTPNAADKDCWRYHLMQLLYLLQNHLETWQSKAILEACRGWAALLESTHPGHSTELRVPGACAIQVGDGVSTTTHRRGTPPSVVECPPEIFLQLCHGTLTWDNALRTFALTASGAHANLGHVFPYRDRSLDSKRDSNS